MSAASPDWPAKRKIEAYSIIWTSQLTDSSLPMGFLSKESVDFVVEVPDAIFIKRFFTVQYTRYGDEF
jgi:hypothetical protein